MLCGSVDPAFRKVTAMADKRVTDFLFNVLRIERFPMIAISGGGGKTSLMFALVDLLKERGRAVATTTAKLSMSDTEKRGELFIGAARQAKDKLASLPRHAAITIAKERDGDKLRGFTPQEADVILKYGMTNWTIVEADGSRATSFKLYEEWEPPIPRLTSLQFVMVGADVFQEPISQNTVFRAELLEKRYGARLGETLTPRMAVAILSSSAEYLKNSPKQARRVLLLNKAELLNKPLRLELTRALSEVTGYELLIVASLRKNVIYDTLALTGGKVAKE